MPTIPGFSRAGPSYIRHVPDRTNNKTSGAPRRRAFDRRRNRIVDRLVTLTAILGWLSMPPVLWQLRCGLVATSLSRLWGLVLVAWLAWGTAGAASLASDLPAGTLDLLWYSVAILLLLPPIAVLGARRPIDRVWPWFVLLPLACVFAWPVLSALGRGQLPVNWNIEEPMLVAYAIVLVMGTGNYLGLRHTLPALLWIAGLVLLIGPLCPLTANFLPTAPAGRLIATVILAASGWLMLAQAKRRNHSPMSDGLPPDVSPGNPRENSSRVDSLWRDFRDTFGIVWARRVQERFNDMMRQQGHSLRLGIDGLESADGKPDVPPDHLSAAESSLRWLLQKFVDREWIEARITA